MSPISSLQNILAVSNLEKVCKWHSSNDGRDCIDPICIGWDRNIVS